MYIFLEPRRLEFVFLKYKNYDKINDNFLDFKNKNIIINRYKNSNTKGQIQLKLDD